MKGLLTLVVLDWMNAMFRVAKGVLEDHQLPAFITYIDIGTGVKNKDLMRSLIQFLLVSE
jgi:hypothetical protein